MTAIASRAVDAIATRIVNVSPIQIHVEGGTRALHRQENQGRPLWMAKKPKTVHKDQLSLFDLGLEGPAVTGRVTLNTLSTIPTVELIATDVERPVRVISSEHFEVHPPAPPEPSPFEKASYELYLRLKGETYGLAKTTSILAIVLVAVVFLDVQIPEAGFGFFKVGSLPRHILVGLIGWLTLLSGGYTLIRAAYMMRKKVDCGLFYQRVLEFSNNAFIRFVHRFLDVLFVTLFSGIIALTWIIAGTEMINLVDFIAREVLLLRDPWRPTVTPAY